MVWLTGGLFLFVWPFALVRDARRLWPESFAGVQWIERAYAVLFAVYIMLLVMSLLQFPAGHRPYLLGMMSLIPVLFAIPAYLVARVARTLRDRRPPSLGPAAAVGLFLLYGISLPMLQSRINAAEEVDFTA